MSMGSGNMAAWVDFHKSSLLCHMTSQVHSRTDARIRLPVPDLSKVIDCQSPNSICILPQTPSGPIYVISPTCATPLHVGTSHTWTDL